MFSQKKLPELLNLDFGENNKNIELKNFVIGLKTQAITMESLVNKKWKINKEGEKYLGLKVVIGKNK